MGRRSLTALVFVSILSGVALAFAPSCVTPNERGNGLGSGDGDGAVGIDADFGSDGGGFDVKDKGAPSALKIDPRCVGGFCGKKGPA